MKKNNLDTPALPLTQHLKGIFRKIPFFAVGGCVLLAVALLTIGYYILFPARGFFHSDCADTLLWAQAAYDGGTLINPDFHYACFLPIGGQLLMLPFIPLFGVSMTTHTIGMMLFLALFAAALVFLFRQIQPSVGFSTTAAATVLLVLAGSDKLREIFYGHVIYYSLGILFLCFGLGLLIKVLRLLSVKTASKRSFFILGGALFVWSMLGAVNQFEILTLFSVPLIGAFVAERFFDFSHTLTHRETYGGWIVLCGLVIATSAGYVIGAALVGDMEASYAGAFSTFSDPEKWFDNLSLFLSHYVTLFGVTATDGQPINEADGIFELIKIITSLIVLIAPIGATILYNKLDRPMRLLVLAHWIVTALIMMGYVFGLLSIANWRLSPILCTATIVTVSLCAWCIKHAPQYQRLTLIAVLPLTIVCVNTIGVVADMPHDLYQDTGLYAVRDTLAEHRQTHGYATFWNSHSLTVISDSEIECRTIEFSESFDRFDKRLYQSNERWFDERHNPCFVLLETAEYRSLCVAGNALITDMDSMITLEDYVILLFETDIFS